MEYIGREGVISPRYNLNLGGQASSNHSSVSPNKTELPNKRFLSYQTTPKASTKSNVDSDSVPKVQNYQSAYQTPYHRVEPLDRDDLSTLKKELHEPKLSLKNLRIDPLLQQGNREGFALTSRELVLQLESTKKQRDFFESEFRRAVRNYHEKNNQQQHSNRPEAGNQPDGLIKEINALKVQYQGETKRQNETITTLKLENAGLRNLRSILETELESLKDIKKQALQHNEKIGKVELENIDLHNQIETMNVTLKLKNEELKKLEMSYRSQLNEKDSVMQALRERLDEVESSNKSSVVLCGIEIERLYTIIDSLYNKIIVQEQAYDEELLKIKEDFKVLNEAQEGERKVILNKLKNLQQTISEQDYIMKTLKEDVDRLRLQEIELEKDVEHWRERYMIIEGSHKYLVDAVEKVKTNYPANFKGILPSPSSFS